VKSQREVEVLDKILQHPPLSAQVEDAWSINLLPEELNETRDKRKGYFDKGRLTTQTIQSTQVATSFSTSMTIR